MRPPMRKRPVMSNTAPLGATNRSAQGTIDSRHRQRKNQKREDKRNRKNALFEDKMKQREFDRQPYSEYNQKQTVVTKTKKDNWDKAATVGSFVQGVGQMAGAAASAFGA
jgi:hypothetical protein